MNAVIAQLTFRQLLGAKRTLLLAGGAMLPVLLAVIFRTAADDVDPARWTAQTLLGGFVVGTLLPLAALVFGTAALGQEIEDGTAVYLLGKPLPRSVILAPKLAVAAGLTAVLVVIAVVVAGSVAALGEPDGAAVIVGFAVATAAGAVVYCALFMLLSVMTGRAFIFGLIYVFLWEQLVTRLFEGTRILSVRQYTLSLAEAVSGVSDRVLDAPLDLSRAIVMMCAVGALATVFAVRRLRRFEIGEAA